MNSCSYQKDHNRILKTDLLGSSLGHRPVIERSQPIYCPFGYCQLNSDYLAGFTGQKREKNPDLYLLGNGYRGYSPTLNRFTAPDSFSPFESGCMNAYAYCEADPINTKDASGHIGQSVIKLISRSLLNSATETISQRPLRGATFFVTGKSQPLMYLSTGPVEFAARKTIAAYRAEYLDRIISGKVIKKNPFDRLHQELDASYITAGEHNKAPTFLTVNQNITIQNWRIGLPMSSAQYKGSAYRSRLDHIKEEPRFLENPNNNAIKRDFDRREKLITRLAPYDSE